MPIRFTFLIFAVAVGCSADTISYSFGDYFAQSANGGSVSATGQSGTIPSDLGDYFVNAWMGSVTFGGPSSQFLDQVEVSISGMPTNPFFAMPFELSGGTYTLSAECCVGPDWLGEVFINGEWEAVKGSASGVVASGIAGQTVPLSITFDLNVSLAPEPTTLPLIGMGLCLLAATRRGSRRRRVIR